MAIDKSLLTGSTAMLILKLLDGQDMYGYQMIDELKRRSDHTFELKAGTLYPLLHSLEKKELINSYEKDEDTQRPRRYYQISRKGKKRLIEKQAEWVTYSGAVNRVMQGGASLANA
jgi:PadR family transcriptional regulator PadR